MEEITYFIIACIGMVVVCVILWKVSNIDRSLPSTIYMKVYLCLRPASDPTNVSKQELLDKFNRFRIVPRIGDTLAYGGQGLKVTETQLHPDTSVTVWCDVIVPDEEMEDRRQSYRDDHWFSSHENPLFRPLLDQDKLTNRLG